MERKKICCAASFVKCIQLILTFDQMNKKGLKKFFDAFALQCLNIEGIENCAGVDNGTVDAFINGGTISPDDLKALKTVIKMLKNQ